MGSFPDPFDVAMIATCNIYEKGVGEANPYNQQNQVLNLVLSNWPCRLSRDTGEKYMKGKEFAVRKYLIFMRPPKVDNNNNPLTLNEHYWAIVTTPGDGAQLKINIEYVLDPSGLGHHLEVKGEMVIP